MKTSLADTLRARPEQRRAFQRYAISMAVLVQPGEGEGARHRRTETAVVTDVSLSGLVFVSTRPHPPGSLVEIQISLGARVHLVRAIVKRSHLLALPGRRAFGCAAQFVRGDSVARFIPALARYLYLRYGDDAP